MNNSSSYRVLRSELLESRYLLASDLHEHPHHPNDPHENVVRTIDDGDSLFAAPKWQATIGNEGDAVYGHPRSSAATWSFASLPAGRYRVEATWTTSSNRATDAVFSVIGGGETLGAAVVNQRKLPGAANRNDTLFRDLGIYETSDGSLQVTLKPGSDGLTIADTVRVTRVESLLPGHYLQTAQSGYWSDPRTWVGGVVPTANDDVVITHNVTIDRGESRHLEIANGIVTLAGTLDVHGSVVVRSTLQSEEGAIRFHVENDRLFSGNVTPGPFGELPDFHLEDKGLWAFPGSSIQLHGKYVTPWLNAAAMGAQTPLQYGATTTLAFKAGLGRLAEAPVGWRVGDSLLLVNEKGESRLATLKGVVGKDIQYQLTDASANADFVGNVISAEGYSLAPKIANLSRRLQIVSADVVEGDFTHRAHSLFFAGSDVNISNVEFRNLGPREKLGRYPVHFHHGGFSDNSLEGSSIWQDVSELGNRFVALHAVQGVTVANNVAYASQGHGFFMEDGNEYGNRIVGNLAVNVANGEELTSADSDVKESHHFWLRTGNTIEGNVAAGGDGIGLVILPSKSSSQETMVLEQEVLGGGKYGIWAFAPDVTFKNARVAFAQQAGFGVSGRWGRDSSGATLINPFLAYNGVGSPTYESQIYLNQAQGISVIGGALYGRKAIHVHYNSSLQLEGTIIRAGTFLTPTYWESAITARNIDVIATKAFDRAYPIRSNSPALLRLIESRWQFGDVKSTSLETVDFTSAAYRSFLGFEGREFQNAWKINKPVADAGYISLPAGITRWKLAASLSDLEKSPIRRKSENPTQWRESDFGYPLGLPPGTYYIQLFNTANKPVGQPMRINVASDAITTVNLTVSSHIVPQP